MVADALVLRREWQEDFVNQVRDLSTALAVGLEAGIFWGERGTTVSRAKNRGFRP